jgi:hypothetical protein
MTLAVKAMGVIRILLFAGLAPTGNVMPRRRNNVILEFGNQILIALFAARAIAPRIALTV